MGAYDTAQICLNGHISNDSMKMHPENNEKYCKECGAQTISKCPNCERGIKGSYFTLKIRPPTPKLMKVPMYCTECGKPYPWTESKIKAAHELVQELEKLSKKDRNILNQSIDEIIKDTPETEVWAVRFKKIVAKAGQIGKEALINLALNLGSEKAIKIITGT